MKKPLIGVTPQYNGEEKNLRMQPEYMDAVLAAGGIPVMLPLSAADADLRELARELDGCLFTGGQDVSPTLYGEEILPVCGEISEERDHMEQRLFRILLEYDRPMLGICRGMQFFNVLLGGTLYQDLPAQMTSGGDPVTHWQDRPYRQPVHSITVVRDSWLAGLYPTGRAEVNSIHHQGVKVLAEGLECMARADDGLPEAMRLGDRRFVVAVQWHPEYLYTTRGGSAGLFDRLVHAGAAGEAE